MIGRSRAVSEVAVGKVIANHFIPDNIAIRFDCGELELPTIVEEGDDALAVPNGSLRGMSVFLMDAFWEAALIDDFCPKDLSARPVDSDKRLRASFLISGGEMNSITSHNGSGMSQSREIGLPADILFSRPFRDRLGGSGGMVVGGGATPMWPIGREGGSSEEKREREGFHSELVVRVGVPAGAAVKVTGIERSTETVPNSQISSIESGEIFPIAILVEGGE